MSNQEADIDQSLTARRLLLFGLIFIGLSAAGFYAIYDRMAERAVTIDPSLFSVQTLLACAVMLVVYFSADALRLYFTLRALGQRIPLPAMGRLVFINLFFSNITPLATGGGFAQILYMKEQGVPLGTAMTATTIRTMVAVFFIFSAAPLFFVNLQVLDGRELSDRQLDVLIGLIVMYLVLFAIVLFRTRWLIQPLMWLLQGLRRMHVIGERRHARWSFGAKREMLRFADGFEQFMRGRPLYIGLVCFFTFVFLLTLFSFPAVLLQGLGYEVEYMTTVGLLTVTTFIMYFSPTPGASGIAEGVFGHFFRGLVSADHLMLVTVAWRFLTIYLGMLIGLLVTQRVLLQRGAQRA